MRTWVFEGALSVGLFIVLIPVMAAPFLAVVYRKYHYLPPWPSTVAAVTGLYVCALVGFTTFPLPTLTSASCPRPALIDYWRLSPLRSYADIWQMRQHLGWAATLTAPDTLQVVFNVVFFVPLGMLIAYRLKRSVFVAAVAGFGVSLLIETTQGTGLWWLYPCPYRTAEVDDLISNTSGAIIGWGIGWLISRVAPFREPPARLDPGPPRVLRRISAAALDINTLVLVSLAVQVCLRLVRDPAAGAPDPNSGRVAEVLVAVVLLAVVPVLSRRRSTPGQAVVLLAEAESRAPGRAAPRRAVLIRFAVRWLPIAILGVMGIAVVALAETIALLVGHGRRSLANRLSGTTTATYTAVEGRYRDEAPQPVGGPHRPMGETPHSEGTARGEAGAQND